MSPAEAPLKRKSQRRLSDRRFFQFNPDRRFRFRHMPVEEIAEFDCHPPPGFRASVLVEQIIPGVRARSLIVHTDWPSPELVDDDDYLADLVAWLRARNDTAARAARAKEALGVHATRH